jgi:hypothetical protein
MGHSRTRLTFKEVGKEVFEASTTQATVLYTEAKRYAAGESSTMLRSDILRLSSGNRLKISLLHGKAYYIKQLVAQGEDITTLRIIKSRHGYRCRNLRHLVAESDTIDAMRQQCFRNTSKLCLHNPQYIR